MRFIFDITSTVVLLLALLAIVGGIGLAGIGVAAAIDADTGDTSGGLVILWGLGAFVQGCFLALVGSYCRLRVDAG